MYIHHVYTAVHVQHICTYVIVNLITVQYVYTLKMVEIQYMGAKTSIPNLCMIQSMYDSATQLTLLMHMRFYGI